MKKQLLEFCLAATLVTGMAQSGWAIPTWAQSYGVDTFDLNGKPNDDPFYGSGHDYPVAMAKMPDGGFVVAGQIHLPELILHAGYNYGPTGALVRFAPDGTILWQTELRQTNDKTENGVYSPALSHVHAVAADASGNIFVAGGKGNTSNGGEQPFVAKFSKDGTLLWDNGFKEGSAVVGNPPQTVPLGVGTIYYMCLTNDGGVAVTLAQSRPNIGYSIPVLAKFNSDGTLAFSKAYENSIQYLGSTPVCQSKDGSRYVMAFQFATDGSALGSRYGLYLLVTDAAGNILAQRGYNHSDTPGEQPVAIVATTDGGFATLSSPYSDGYFGILRKFNADLSAELFEKRITITPGQARGFLATNSLIETADGGFLIGGATQDQNGSNPSDVMLMKLSSGGALEFVSLLGGPKNEGAPLSYNPTTAFAIQTTDGGYGLAATSQSYHVGRTISGGYYDIPDWWMAKTDTNRKVRNFKDIMLDQPLGTYTLTGLPEVGANPTAFSAPGYAYGPATTSLPQFILQDLGAKNPPNEPTVIIQASSPRIVSSRVAEAVVGQHFAYHIIAGFFGPTSTLTYSATGLPAGFVIDPATGVISGIAAIGSETSTPILVTLSGSDGTDTATATLGLTIGDGVPHFAVNDSDQPAYPNSAVPVTGLADSVLTFTARYPGKPAGRFVSVQATTNPQGAWADLDNGTTGNMWYDPTAAAYVLGSTSYPTQNSVYFRAKVKAQGFADVVSNVVGPFDLSTNKSRAGRTLFSIKPDGLRGDFDFRAAQLSAAAGVTLRVQSTTAPESEASWTNLKNTAGTALPGMNQDDSTNYSLVTNNLAEGKGIYFRAIAAGGSGVVDSVSNLIGPYSVKFTVPPQVTIISPAGGGVGGSLNAPLIISADASGVAAIDIHASATAGTNRSITHLSILFDGSPIYTVSGGTATASVQYQKNIGTVGDHVLEVLAFDDLGVTGRAGTGPLYIRIVPSGAAGKAAGVHSVNGAATSALGGRVYHVVISNGYWINPTTWQDSNGNNGVPGKYDLAVIGAATVNCNTPNQGENLEVGSVSINGGHLYGPGGIAINGVMTVGGASFDNDMTLIIRPGAILELVNSANFVFNIGTDGFYGTLLNVGTINVHGAGGLTGVADFTNAGWINFQVPLLPSTAAAAALSVDPRVVSADVVHDSGKISVDGHLITNDGGSLITNDGGSLITNDGGSLITNDGGSLITNDGGSLITNDGGSLITNDGGSLLTRNGASLIAPNGGSLIAPNGAALISPNGGAIVTGVHAGGSASRGLAAAPQTGYIKVGGETDLSGLFILGDVTLNGGVFSGTGVISGNLTNNAGYITPGHSPGTLTVTGNLTQSSNGTIVMEAAGAEAGQFDLIEVGGSATLGGRLDFHTINGYVPLAGDPLNPIGYKTVSGAFNSVSSNTNITLNGNGLLAVITPNAPNPTYGQPTNISTRMKVLTNDNVLIGGFIVNGASGSTKKVLIHGLGPSLSSAHLTGLLSDPLLEFHYPDGSVITNDNWGDAPNKDQIPNGYELKDSKESLIIADLAPGVYTVHEKGAHGETGIGLAQIFDIDGSTTVSLSNVSTRGFVDTGDNVMIGGFIVSGNEPGTMLVKVPGPSLKNPPASLAGVLEDPTLELHDSYGNVLTNDDWRETQETEIIATNLAPKDDREPAILATLAPGVYTAIVRGKNDTTGIAIVEAYRIK